MNRKLFIGIVSCILAMSLHAQTTRVLRFEQVAGSESEVVQSSLQKVVFTRDSVVLIAAADGAATPMYKYDYKAIVFAESSPTEIEEVGSETVSTVGSEKFLRNGQLFIRLDEQVYNIMGLKIEN